LRESFLIWVRRQECFECGGLCNIITISSPSAERSPEDEGIFKFSWKCSQCGRRFNTIKHMGKIGATLEGIEKIFELCDKPRSSLGIEDD
jgi:hypothetical protein